MSFYSELSKAYDIVFPMDTETLSFLCEGLNESAKVIDIACGSGSYAAALADKKYNVIGIDLDSSMIKLAENKKGSNNVEFRNMDMKDIKKEYGHKKFDLIYCIGNSIAHLKDKSEIKNLIKDMYDLLNEKGVAIIQIVNYDRILKYNVKSLPTIDRSSSGVKFVRNYRHSSDESIIYFDTELIISEQGTETKYENSVPLLPIQSSELSKMMEETGFCSVETYGDFSKEEFNDKSFALVLRAYK